MRLESLNRIFAFLLCAFCRIAAGDVVETDFKVSEMPAGWDLATTSYDSSNGRKFSEDGQWMSSPVSDGAIVSAVARCKMFGSGIAGSGSALKIEGRTSPSDEWSEAGILFFESAASTNHNLKISRECGFRQLKFTFLKGAGTLRVLSVGIEWRRDGEISPPYGLRADRIGNDSFQVSWLVDETVDGFVFDCWEEIASPWTGRVLWGENFDAALNEGKSPKALDDDSFDAACDNSGWSGSYVYLPAGGEGELQVGKASDAVGALLSPPLEEMDDVELVVRARAFAEQSSMQMPVALVSGSITNDIASFELGTTFADHHCRIGRISKGERLVFGSFGSGSQRRVGIDAVSLVDGYRDGVPVTNFVESGAVMNGSQNCGRTVEGLEAEREYFVSVKAFRDGGESAPTGPLAVRTAGAENMADALPLSTLKRTGSSIGFREDFSGAADVFVSSSNVATWENGKTFGGWQAYRGVEPFDALTRNFGAATASGLYVYCIQGQEGESYSLGTMTSSTAPDFLYGIVFRNDLGFEVSKVSIGFDALQYGFRNETAQQLHCEYAVSDELQTVVADCGWIGDAKLLYETAENASSGLVGGTDAPVKTVMSSSGIDVSIPPGGYFMLRWRRMSASRSAAIAIDNVTVGFVRESRGLSIVIR